MVSPTSQQTRVFEWMRSHLDADGSVTLKDLTSMYTVINVVGHKSRQLLSELSNTALNLHSFTYRVSSENVFLISHYLFLREKKNLYV